MNKHKTPFEELREWERNWEHEERIRYIKNFERKYNDMLKTNPHVKVKTPFNEYIKEFYTNDYEFAVKNKLIKPV